MYIALNSKTGISYSFSKSFRPRSALGFDCLSVCLPICLSVSISRLPFFLSDPAYCAAT